MAAGTHGISASFNSLQGIIFNRKSFSSQNLQEKFPPSYFTFADDESDKFFPFLEQMKRQHRKCPYQMLLKYYCPCSLDLPIQRKKGKTKRLRHLSILQDGVLKDHCSISSVYAFVCVILKRLLPLEFFGSLENRNCFLKHVHLLLSVQMHGEMSLLYLTRGIKLSKMSWLKNLGIKEQKELFLKCVNFLMTRMICPLIQWFFYIVESSHAKAKLFFFRKRVWHKLCHKAFADFAKFCKLSFILYEAFQKYRQERMCLGCARLSFVVKTSSLRPICNFSFREKANLSINDHLKTLLVVLNHIKATYPTKFGVMGMGKTDLQAKLKDFLLKMKVGNVEQLYFVTADIEKCFDSVNPTHLFDIVADLINSDLYMVHKYRKTLHGKNTKFKFFESVNELSSVQAHHKEDIALVSEFVVTRTSLLKTLKALLLFNIVKLGRHYYRQKKGIAQGSKVSSVLCAAYLGKIEEAISIPKGQSDFCVRMEDEYLLLTNQKSTASGFLENLSSGLKVYEWNINLKKCSTNFDVIIDSQRLITKSSLAKFYGLCIDPCELSVSSDYSSYQDLKAGDVVTWKLCKNPGQYFKEHVLKSLLPKCDFILFDKDINTDLRIKKNALKIFCMTAVKFHFLVTHLPPENAINNNPSFFANIIFQLPLRLKQIISSRLFKSLGMKQVSHRYPLSEDELQTLCYNAFLFKMKEQEELYQKLIPKIEAEEVTKKGSILNSKSEIFVQEAFQEIYLK